MTAEGILYRTFRPGDEAAFLQLNEEWISKMFEIEPADREIISDPRKHILAGGGQICIAEAAGEAIGCCALIAIASGRV